MRIDELLYTEREGNTIHLGVKDSHNAIFLLGTSVRSKPGRSLVEDHKRITFYPEEGKEGIIALCVPLYPPTLRKRQDAERIPTFLKLSWDEGSKQHTLAILETWILPERRGFVTGHGISVTLQDGTDFVTPYAGLPGTPADTNLLCKYLAGEVSDDDVRNAALRT
ncbi:MAG TPA: hypothetical protein VJ579_02400 [Candidatus Paceibacterota bacterium]|nr:hypothetical protein [Candidatus Paceibacterota bacterium]